VKRDFSFEFFPPKTAEGIEKLRATRRQLAQLEPTFFSVTYGAGGSTRDGTLATVLEIIGEGQSAAPHLSCVASTKANLREVIAQYKASGIKHIVALRGDLPSGLAVSGEFRYASELVRFIRERDHHLCLGGAGYPEGHIETPLREDDLKNLKAKVDAGLDFVITQLFFDNAFYFDFVERARRVGINVPIVPGIMPITNIEQLERFVRLCGATVPMRLVLQLERYRDDPDAVVQLGVAHATVQCMELLARGVPGIHFYTLNKSPATRLIVSALKGRVAGPPFPPGPSR